MDYKNIPVVVKPTPKSLQKPCCSPGLPAGQNDAPEGDDEAVSCLFRRVPSFCTGMFTYLLGSSNNKF